MDRSRPRETAAPSTPVTRASLKRARTSPPATESKAAPKAKRGRAADESLDKSQTKPLTPVHSVDDSDDSIEVLSISSTDEESQPRLKRSRQEKTVTMSSGDEDDFIYDDEDDDLMEGNDEPGE